MKTTVILFKSLPNFGIKCVGTKSRSFSLMCMIGLWTSKDPSYDTSFNVVPQFGVEIYSNKEAQLYKFLDNFR